MIYMTAPRDPGESCGDALAHPTGAGDHETVFRAGLHDAL